ncbi:MAG: hypothetical protein JW863_02785 [Chitinispirillaceae bacterium]|nr:hypothetical protein [Chitinispirillaceae bacterium]
MHRCLGFFLTVLLVNSFIFAQDDLTTEGTGIGVNRDEALMAAKRDAVEKGIGMVLLSQTEIENFQLKRDIVVTKTIGTVSKYEIISETRNSDATIEIKIRAQLSKSAMRQDLAAFNILIESMDKPRVMVLIDENNIGTSEPANQAAETAILSFLKDPYDFNLVDKNVSLSIKSSRQKMADLNGNPAAAAAIGLQNGAEVLITGTATSKVAEGISQNLGGMVSVQADVTLKAINCNTGAIAGSAAEHAARVHISPQTAGNQAIAKAAQKAAGKLLDMIIKNWQNQVNNGLSISVTVNEVKIFRQKNAVITTLTGMSGVSAVRERSWDATSAQLQLEVVYKGNTNGFCTKVDGFKLKSGGGSLAVTGVNGQNVTLVAQAL